MRWPSHTQIEAPAVEGWQFRFQLDEPSCAYFKDHSSSWRLVLEGPLLQKIRSVKALTVAIDNQPPSRVTIPSVGSQPVVIESCGLGHSHVEVGTGRFHRGAIVCASFMLNGTLAAAFT